MQPTQAQLFEQSRRDVATVNADFLWLVENGMTREDLERCIERRPALWSRFAGWLDNLPSKNPVSAV